jgi:NADPH:quinone reductase-like Zn-dependent oxidoreductase
VLIALQAAGVGVWDADIRGGWWPSGRPRFPLVLGTDGAGVVAAKGYDGEVSQQRLAHLEHTADETRLQVQIAAVFPLAQAARAHARLRRGQVIGRIVLRIARGGTARLR